VTVAEIVAVVLDSDVVVKGNWIDAVLPLAADGRARGEYSR
jgi:hypothetical protein